MARTKKKSLGSLHELPGITGKGVEPLVIDDIAKAAGKYERKKNERCDKTPGEIAAKQELREAMHENRVKLPLNGDGNPFYRHEGVDYILTEKLTRQKADDGQVRGEEV